MERAPCLARFERARRYRRAMLKIRRSAPEQFIVAVINVPVLRWKRTPLSLSLSLSLSLPGEMIYKRREMRNNKGLSNGRQVNEIALSFRYKATVGGKKRVYYRPINAPERSPVHIGKAEGTQ